MSSGGPHIARDSFRFVHGKNQNAAISGQLGDLGRGLESTHRRHGYVENNYIGLQPLDRFNGLLSIAGFAANFPFRMGAQQYTANPVPYDFVIIDD
jgi:hypothetical protein